MPSIESMSFKHLFFVLCSFLLILPSLHITPITGSLAPITDGDSAIWDNLNGGHIFPFHTNAIQLTYLSTNSGQLNLQLGFWSGMGRWNYRNASINDNATTIFWFTTLPQIGDNVTDLLYQSSLTITEIQNIIDPSTGQAAIFVNVDAPNGHWTITYDHSSQLALRFTATLTLCCGTVLDHYALFNTTINLGEPQAPPIPANIFATPYGLLFLLLIILIPTILTIVILVHRAQQNQ